MESWTLEDDDFPGGSSLAWDEGDDGSETADAANPPNFRYLGCLLV